MKPLSVYIGYDEREAIALYVCMHAINRLAKGAVSIIPLNVNQLGHIYTRGANGTTAFSLTRFLVPFLSGYEGVSIFMDCDMLPQVDIRSVLDECHTDVAVDVCQHDYVPKPAAKATGAQTAYPMKNWSSFMVFKNDWCEHLTPEYVNTASPADLHRLAWAQSVGSLPLDWNWLVGEYEPKPDARNLHYTLGTPCFHDYRNCDHADLWWAELTRMGKPLDLSWLGLKAAKYRVTG